MYRFYVAENDAVGVRRQLIGTVTAQDADYGENGQVSYHISSRSSLALFDIQVTVFLKFSCIRSQNILFEQDIKHFVNPIKRKMFFLVVE